jgi:hypothetical protein
LNVLFIFTSGFIDLKANEASKKRPVQQSIVDMFKRARPSAALGGSVSELPSVRTATPMLSPILDDVAETKALQDTYERDRKAFTRLLCQMPSATKKGIKSVGRPKNAEKMLQYLLAHEVMHACISYVVRFILISAPDLTRQESMK